MKAKKRKPIRKSQDKQILVIRNIWKLKQAKKSTVLKMFNTIAVPYSCTTCESEILKIR